MLMIVFVFPRWLEMGERDGMGWDGMGRDGEEERNVEA